MIDYFQLFVLLGWFFSLLLIIYSYKKYKYITMFDIFVIFTWFYVFFRPLFVFQCDINKDLYVWDEDFYIYGQIISISMLLLMQLGANIINKKNYFTYSSIKKNNIMLVSILNYVFFITFFVVVIIFVQFGSAIFPFNRGGGALSVSLPGVELYFYILRTLFFIIIFLSLYMVFINKKWQYIFYFLFSLIILLMFSKRGVIVSPIIFFLVIFSFYNLVILKKSIFSLINLELMVLGFILIIVVFFGKTIYHSNQNFSTINTEEKLSCKILKKGQQEFDLFWPAILENSSLSNITYIPTALVGGVLFSHNERLNNENELFHSATDKLMLKYNKEVYLEKKFGISPNFFQFLFYYLNIFSIIFIFLFGYLFRKIEFIIIENFFKGRFFYSYMYYLILGIVFSPIDFTLKYNLVYFTTFLFLVLVYHLYKTIKGFKFNG